MEKVVDKLIKEFTIGELNFKVGITRAIAYKGLRRYPDYMNALLSDKTTQKLLQNNSIEELQKVKDRNGALELFKKNPNLLNDFGEAIELKKKEDEYAVKIVNFLLPEMLEYAESDLCGCEDYEALAKRIIEYCDENDILYDCHNYETNDFEQGFYSQVMSVVSMGFTLDSVQRKKGKLQIIVK